MRFTGRANGHAMRRQSCVRGVAELPFRKVGPPSISGADTVMQPRIYDPSGRVGDQATPRVGAGYRYRYCPDVGVLVYCEPVSQ